MRACVSVRILTHDCSQFGTYAVLGNHDYVHAGGTEAVVAALQAAGVRVLRNELVQIPVGVTLAGLGDPAGRDFRPQDCLPARLDHDMPLLVLVHSPDTAEVPSPRYTVPPRLLTSAAGAAPLESRPPDLRALAWRTGSAASLRRPAARAPVRRASNACGTPPSADGPRGDARPAEPAQLGLVCRIALHPEPHREPRLEPALRQSRHRKPPLTGCPPAAFLPT